MRLHSFTVKVCAVAMAMGSLTSCHTKELLRILSKTTLIML